MATTTAHAVALTAAAARVPPAALARHGGYAGRLDRDLPIGAASRSAALKSISPGNTDEIAAALRAEGLRATDPRVGVYRALTELGGHRSADEIATHLLRSGRAFARASVYNGLETLAHVGMILRTEAGPAAALYEVSTQWHHHFVCRRCHRVIDVPCATGRPPCLTPDPALGLAVDQAQVIFRGYCWECADRP